ncbi:carbonic anhydrase [Thioalbus denitrificans]|uniref:Carbonic anhydrase n=1 Tax=Thioalbus denitrificans TaxID=547122 RepID=A0A369CD44_9GAMM|nr:carbonic anhydrase [Thioalbus denitrificans]RCX31055.1 carbonic anhydrase [Thioalbus denitrificans]
MNAIDELLQGYGRFRAGYYPQKQELFDRLSREGQSPRVAMVACCDSRVDPAIILDCSPGEMFVIRNVANLVPPYEQAGTYHGTSAALEFAVLDLQVEHVVIMGHAYCGGIRSLITTEPAPGRQREFIGPWMDIARDACKVAFDRARADAAHPARECEQAGVRASLDNLRTFPWVRDREAEGRLQLHGWYFDLDQGELLALDAETDRFEVIEAPIPESLERHAL